MADIPRAVLSEHIQDCLKGRRLISAVFLTFQFDPGFFEQEVLPVLLDVSVSHAAAIRLVQLEDALRLLAGHIAVYFDANGIVTSDSGSAKLDIRRIAVRHRTGIFHPKNIFLLVEQQEPDEEGRRARTLVVVTMSANLTRAGWWENLEVCHVEQVPNGGKTRLRNDLLAFLMDLRRRSTSETEHLALRDIIDVVRRTEPRALRSADDRLHTHFYGGREAVPEFLDRVAGPSLRGTYLEVLSPYFDDATSSRPLTELMDHFEPKETRVFLPRSADGAALCREELYESVRATPSISWGRLPQDLLRLGRNDDAGRRLMHAKVYRFFTQYPKREILFVGSANLTSAAHQTGGNVESGFLVEIDPLRKPEFWLSTDERKPKDFQVRTENEAVAASGGTPLTLRYSWDIQIAEAFWDAAGVSPTLQLAAQGILLGYVGPFAPRVWVRLSSDFAARLADTLATTSLVEVISDGEPALLLVQEDGMSHKPSLLMHLSAADILSYWSLLTPEQRTAFLESRAPELALLGEGAHLLTRIRRTLD
ncbi:MAG: hypothetical protein H0V79_03820, partial [Actinobacteria bacterium]|nr:hypothetical protein [Actinomycetota bacterium]